MRVERLNLTNFRGIERMEVNFPEHTTAFVGVNGVGKSTILDALAIALSQLTWRINNHPQKARPISPDDIRLGADFARIEVTVTVRSRPVTWSVVTNRRRGHYSDPHRRSELDALNEAIRALDDEWEHVESERQEPYDLPMAVYYDVHRAVLDIPMRVRERLRNNPYEIYQDALDHGGADFKRFFIWFRNREDFENEQLRDDRRYRDRSLEAVRSAITSFTGFNNVRIRRSPLRMTVEKHNVELNVEQLSDGEKNMLALVGDMARRLSVLNPSLTNPNEGEGVALIDELDLHLHPRWQRQVVRQLEQTFPNCQLIVSTHSPQIIGELVTGSIYLLRGGENCGHPRASYGLTSSAVLEELMEAHSRPVEVERDLNTMYTDIERLDLESAKAKLSGLRQTAPGIPELDGAEALIRRKEILGR